MMTINETELENEVSETKDDPVAAGENPRGGLWTRLRSWVSGRTRTVLVAVLVVVLTATAGGAWLHSGRSVFGAHAGAGVLSFLPDWLPGDVAFRYGEREVGIDELDGHIAMLSALYGVRPPAPERMGEFKRDAAKSYAVSLVLDDAAESRGIQVADKQARDTLSRFVTERLGPGPEAYSRFIGTIADSGTSERVVLEELSRRLSMAELFDQVTKVVKVPNERQVREAYQARQAELGRPEMRRISNIVVATRADADRVAAELRAGGEFEQLARRDSMDGSTRDRGGDLGSLAREQLEPGYAGAAFSAGKGQTFGPVRTQHGWNVGIVRTIAEPKPADFDAVKEELTGQLHAEAALTEWRSWLRDAIADADVQYAEEYRPADPDAPPAAVDRLTPGEGPR